MNIKIQGGDGVYSNTGSSIGIVNYLEHEDLQRAIEGEKVEQFFSHYSNNIASAEVIENLDNNKQKLSKEDAKFFVVTISPSTEELKKMGNTPQEMSNALKDYVKNQVMEKYAENFGKNLTANDLMYYGKIHFDRKGKNELDIHAHIVVSRKSLDKKMKLSPMTNHRNTTTGMVKGGFDREKFFQKSENEFDKKHLYQRDYKNSFEYLNAMKNGDLDRRREAIQKAMKLEQEKHQEKEVKKTQKIEQQNSKNQSLTR